MYRAALIVALGALAAIGQEAPPAAPVAAAVPERAAQVANTARLLQNDTFAQWEGNLPVGWQCAEPQAVSQAAEGETGKPVVSVQPIADKPVDLRQFVKPDVLLEGDMIVFHVEAYAETPGGVQCTLRINQADGGRVVIHDTHPGAGWARMRVAHPLPDKGVENVECRVRVTDAGDKPVRIRQARAEVAPAIP